MLLSSLIPDVDDLLSREPQELGCALLKVLAAENPDQRHRYNFLLSKPATGYPPAKQKQVEEAINEAWEWLRSQRHLIPRTDSNNPEFLEISRSGKTFLENCSVDRSVSTSVATTSDDALNPAVPQSSLPPSEDTPSDPDSIDPSAAADGPTRDDKLQFRPYVSALAAFLNAKNTKPPFTLSVEGEWGSGKSSFMLQLQDEIRRLSPSSTTVWFNPWRYEKQDELWAAFALTLSRTLRKESGFWRRLLGDLKLFKGRINGFVGWTKFVAFFLLWISVLLGSVGVVTWSLSKTKEQQRDILTNVLDQWSKPEHDKGVDEKASEKGATDRLPRKTAEVETGPNKSNRSDDENNNLLPSIYAHLLALGTRGGSVAILLAIISLIGKSLRDKLLDFRLERFLDKPDYKGHTAFLDSFYEDFGKAVEAYAKTEDSKIYVFIDDLDRCEIPKAAELIQAINLMIGDAGRLIFVLAIDRQKVAAGISQKFKDVLPLLVEPDSDESADGARSRLSFGYSFLEKFIQLSVRVPTQSDPVAILAFLDSLTPVTTAHTEFTSAGGARLESNATKPPATQPVPLQVDYNRIETKGESERIRRVVLMVSDVFQNNPRRLKLFLNSYRLSLYLASGQGLLDIRHDNRDAAVTPEQLGKFIALTMRLPTLLDVLIEDKAALADYESRAIDKDSSAPLAGWIDKNGVRQLLRYGVVEQPNQPFDSKRYSLARFPVEKMLSAVPLAPAPKTEQTVSPLNLQADTPDIPQEPSNQQVPTSVAPDRSASIDIAQGTEQSRSSFVESSGGSTVAFARYETKGELAKRVEVYVKSSDSHEDPSQKVFTFEASTGERAEGNLKDIALRFVTFDKQLQLDGYVRMQAANYMGGVAFNL